MYKPRPYDPMFQNLPPCMRRLGYWLLLLTRPGQMMEFVPQDMGVKAETIQSYVYELGHVLGQRFKVTAGVCKNETGGRRWRDPSLPVFVRRIY